MPASPVHTTSTLKQKHSFWFRFENLGIYGPSIFVTKKSGKRGDIFKAAPESLSY